jgi:hypothetical protein
MFQTEVVEKIKTLIFFSITFFPKTRRVGENVIKYYRAGEATD